MADVALRRMTSGEYAVWLPTAIADYAGDHIKAGSMPADRAHEMAAKQFAELLPDGVESPGHHVLVAEADGEPIGMLWLNIPGPPATHAFVYDVVVDEDQRGKGYGRATMVAAEDYSRSHGADTIRLHVFGANTVARGLYESLGYVATNINMAKPLS